MNRNNNIQNLKNQTFDICIIGGGASGVGCALDAALRGLKVCLIEADDYAAKTSSRSTKLIHGGVRYLEQAFKKLDFEQLRQVKHGLEERATLLRNAPHLSRPLALLTPCHSAFEAVYFAIGLRMYGWFAKNDFLPKSEWLNKKKTFDIMPNLTPKVHSSIRYYDGQLDDARYCLAIAQTAVEKGVTMANHLQVIDFQKNTNHKLEKTIVKDNLTGEKFGISAKVFINCTGPAADTIRLLANEQMERRITRSKGVHAVFPLAALGSQETALLIPETTDGRVIYAIPWEGQLLVGTTDTPYPESEENPILEDSEADFIIENLNKFIAKTVEKTQIKSGFGGLRPLLSAKSRNTKQLLRDHEVEHDEKSNLFSLLGGKWTTYRIMAKDTIDAVCEQLGNQQPCQTETQLLVGAENYDSESWKTLSQQFDIQEDMAKHLNLKYGSRAIKVLEGTTAAIRQRLLSNYPYCLAEVTYAVKEEMACTLEDVLSRRMRLEFLDWQACNDAVAQTADLMSQILGWNEEIKLLQIQTYKTLLANYKKNIAG
jgi:glycerol-3-phosphate dehydrogenase